MSIEKLFIFSKDTDAAASIRGYNFQTLKTLETWLLNLLNNTDEVIYCDYEEDIFQKNQLNNSINFRQLKLYSTNFSFKSEEITKCIAHFFMLHTKTDYKDFDKQFIFETNAKIAGKYKDNDAQLLKEWFENQESPTAELLSRCTAKVKEIVSNYVNDTAARLGDKIDKTIIAEAQNALKELSDEEWERFTKLIKWRFANTTPEEEFTDTISRIESLILSLPFDFDKEDIEAIFGILYKEVSLVSSNEKPEDRGLTIDRLRFLILNSNSQKDKWYAEVYEKWKDADITYFNIGQFQEILNAAQYCRRKKYLSSHNNFWIELLNKFIEEIDVTDYFKKQAVYEYVWLRFNSTTNYKEVKGNLKGDEERIRYYFKDFSEFTSAKELEDAHSLLQIIWTAKILDKTDLTDEEIEQWMESLQAEIVRQLDNTTNPNEICHLYELIATHALFEKESGKRVYTINEIITFFEKILENIDSAIYYNASTLSTRINQYISLFIQIDSRNNLELIKALEEFSEKLDPIVQKREGEHLSARKQVERGANYIETNEPELLLKALFYFHKAKDLWNHEETLEGFFLSLVNISQLYLSLGMNFAAKYYALCGFWVSQQNKELYERMPDALGFVFLSDYKQGAWMTAFSDFYFYMKTRLEFKSGVLDYEKEEFLFKRIMDFTSIIYISKKLYPQFNVLTDSIQRNLNDINEEFIQPLLIELESVHRTEDTHLTMIENKLDDLPYNDVGKKRIVKFNALGSLWEISFANDYKTNSVAEEFCAMLQIMLVEISLFDADFHLVKGNIKIEIEISEEVKPPEQLYSVDAYKWKVFIPYSDESESEKITLNVVKTSTALMYILDEISLLKHTEFQELYWAFFQKHNLKTKTLIVNSYQRIYRTLISNEEFEKLHRQSFESLKTSAKLPKENNIMNWNKSLSSKYDRETSIKNIESRFKNAIKCIHITLSRLKTDKQFQDLIIGLRKDGWLDWQIILGIMNFILNDKTQTKLTGIVFSSEDEHIKAINVEFEKFLHMDEKDCYREYPVEAFLSDEFKFSLYQTYVIILKSYGLENKSRFPNPLVIRDFLEHRFNMMKDDFTENNPLFDIQ
ncbi:MAG: hypothetical protein JWN78_646 [Bacteroidota bacterium]|nr:hypothetical protein [Bacteroidota bacterium]